MLLEQQCLLLSSLYTTRIYRDFQEFPEPEVHSIAWEHWGTDSNGSTCDRPQSRLVKNSAPVAEEDAKTMPAIWISFDGFSDLHQVFGSPWVGPWKTPNLLQSLPESESGIRNAPQRKLVISWNPRIVWWLVISPRKFDIIKRMLICS